MSINGNGADYAPLKQIVSDSETDDDINVQNGCMKATDSCNNLDFNSGLQSSKNYSLSDMDEFNTNLNTLETTLENVSILQSENSKKMSCRRRVALITSINVCIVVVATFLWGIPCKDALICDGTHWTDTISWEAPFNEIELSGKGQIVDGVIPKLKNVIFIYRGNYMKKNSNPNENANGVLLIVGNTGKIGWYTRESRIPTYINCQMIDVNKDKQKDCIVSGKEGLLSALNPLSGTYHWYVHKQGKFISNITSIDFPLAIKDIDDDKVDDLLTVTTLSPNTNHNTLLLISGATGNIINDFTTLDACTSVKLMYEDTIITYICKNSTTEAVRMITYPLIMKMDENINSSKIIEPFTSKKFNTTWKENGKQIFTFGSGKLIMENSGKCPDSCRVSLKLVFEKDSVTNVTWEYSANHVFAMRPIIFVFANAITGFVIKLRQWNSAQLVMGSQKIDEIRYNVQNQSPKNPYDAFYNQPPINIPSIAAYIKHTNFTVYSLSERVVLVTFDKVQMHSINISQTDLIQFCARGLTDTQSSEPICQPSLDYQELSIVYGDFNSDKSHEVVSYYTTFVAPDQYTKSENWHLTSIVKVTRLESDIPKLFNENKYT